MSLKCLYIKFCNFISSTLSASISAVPLFLLGWSPPVCSNIHVNGIHCVSECVMSSSESWDLVTGHCDNNNFPAPVLCYHPITHSGMGWTLRKWGQSGENQPIRGESWDVLTNQRAECTNGNYGWISDNIPSYPPWANINIVWTVVKLYNCLGHLVTWHQ